MARYLFASQNKRQKEKQKQKKKEGLPQLGPTHRGSPAQGHRCLLPRARQAAAAVASMPSMPSHLLLAPSHIAASGRFLKPSRSISPLQRHPFSLRCSISPWSEKPPERTAVDDVATAP